jgi:hypothetical protein
MKINKEDRYHDHKGFQMSRTVIERTWVTIFTPSF